LKRLISLILVGMFIMCGSVLAAEWTEPKVWDHCTEGVERTPWYDANTRTLYFVKDYNIFQSKLVIKEWSKPVQVEIPGVNTKQNQINPLRRGNHLYFASYSPKTDYDFYMSTWDEKVKSWSKPIKLEDVSSDGQDWDSWVSGDETLMYIISKGPFGGKQVRGGRGVWKSVKKDGEWTTPIPLEGKINSEVNEWSVFMDKESGRIYIDSNREGSLGSYDIWVLEGEDGVPENLGAPINTNLAERSLWTDGKLMFFTGLNYESGIGGYDIFVSFKKEK